MGAVSLSWCRFRNSGTDTMERQHPVRGERERIELNAIREMCIEILRHLEHKAPGAIRSIGAASRERAIQTESSDQMVSAERVRERFQLLLSEALRE